MIAPSPGEDIHLGVINQIQMGKLQLWGGMENEGQYSYIDLALICSG
jgi:hypothetical protein